MKYQGRTPFLLQKVKNVAANMNPLSKYLSNEYSQYGEDGIISHIISVIGTQTRYCIEFGAWDGVHLSNCCNLVKNRGWSGLFIESDSTRHSQLAKNYEKNSGVVCINRFVDFRGPNRIDSILSEHKVLHEPDIMSIDIDGCDYFIWESMCEFRPRLIVIEFNPTVPNDVLFVQAQDLAVNQGCSLLALIELGRRKGYELVATTLCNAFFILREYYPLFGIVSNNIADMFSPSQDGRIFHGYDSTIHVAGMSHLVWSQIPLNNEDFQVLPESLRKYG